MNFFSKIQFKIEKISSRKVISSLVIASFYIVSAFTFYPGNLTITILAILFSLISVLLGFITLKTDNIKVASLLNLSWGIFCISLIMLSSFPTVFNDYILKKYFLNIILAVVIILAFLVITNRFRLSITLTSVALTIFILVSLILIEFRGRPLTPLDFLSFTTALNVANQYTFVLNKRMIFVVYCMILGVFSQVSIPHLSKSSAYNLHKRIICAIFSIICIIYVYFASSNIPIRNWHTEGLTHNGCLLNFVINFHYMKVDPPANYSTDIIENYSPQYRSTYTTKNENLPNIIVIMNESFGDFNVFEKPASTNIEVTPFINSLSDNTIKGYALSSIFAGNTSNSEFEFLTGNSMAFFPSYSTPYQQYINNPKFSLPWFLKSIGYNTMATHPYLSSGWSRTLVYPLLGFDNYTFIEDYPNKQLVRNYISDQEMYEYLLEKLEDPTYTTPAFIFGVSMQNHGGYEYSGENTPNNIKLVGYNQSYPLTEQYLSLINESDNAIEYLISELKDFPENTIILFFGDHLPGIEYDFYKELINGDISSFENQMCLYKIPFFIWANYDIPSANLDCTSINYLSRYLLEYSGIQLPEYYRTLADIENVIPSINAYGYYSKSKGMFIPFKEAVGIEEDMINLYHILHYNNMIDTQNRNDIYFNQYIK